MGHAYSVHANPPAAPSVCAAAVTATPQAWIAARAARRTATSEPPRDDEYTRVWSVHGAHKNFVFVV